MTGLAAWSLGRACLRAPMPWPLQLAAGSALLSVAVFLLLLAGIAKPAAFVLLAVACLAAGRVGKLSLALGGWWTAGALPFFIWYLITALAPEIQPDSLNYHLKIAIEARSHGGFPSGLSFFDLVPQGLETLFAMAYSIGRDPGAKLLSLLYLVATVPLMVHAGALLGLPAAACRAAGLFYFVTPVVGIAGSCTYSDTALAFFSVALFCLLLESKAWAAGLCAGFCYAIKFTGGVAAAAALVVLAARRRWPETGQFLAAVALVAGPWLVRNAWLTGNPFAPLMNRIFPNPFFHVETEQKLSAFLRSYGVSWTDIPFDLAISGGPLQGLLGPAWLLAPIALIALKHRAGRLLWAAAAVCLMPWFLNLGARFTIPALPFLALALFTAIPLRAAPILFLLHAAACLPVASDRYAAPDGWRLREFPWRVAFGLESREDYRKRVSLEHNLALLVRHHTGAGDRILDLADAPAAITGRHLINNWQSALGDRLLRSVINSSVSERWPLYEWKAAAPAVAVRGVRIVLKEPAVEPWNVHEIRLGGTNVSGRWMAAASGYVEEAPLAADGNLTTFWSPWDRSPAGTAIEFAPPAPVSFDQVRVVTGQLEALGVEVLTDSWKPLEVSGPAPLAKLNLRPEAMRAVKKERIGYLLARKGNNDAMGQLGIALSEAPRNWGLTPLGTYEFFSIYRVD